MKLRCEYRVDSELRFLGNFDMMHLMERALRRSRLPFILSAGFNPHIRLSMGTVLPVGLYGRREYFDLELQDMAVDEFIIGLNQELPTGIAINQAVILPERHTSLMQSINAAVYHFWVNAAATDLEFLCQHLQSSESLPVDSRGKKKHQVKDLRPGLHEITWMEVEPWLQLQFTVSVNEPLNVRYDELLDLLSQQGLSQERIIDYYREGNLIRSGARYYTPLEKVSEI